MTERSSSADKLTNDLSRGVALHNGGDLAAAEKIYLGVLDQLPSHPDALHLLGLIKYQGGDALRACELIRQAISSDPEKYLYYNNLSIACLDLKLHSEAVQAAEKAVRLAPRNADSLATLGNVLYKTGQTSRSESLLRQALQLNSEHVDALATLGYLLLQEKRYEEAGDALEKVTTIAPSHTSALVGYGKTLIKLERPQEAIKVFKSAHANAPSSSTVCTFLADALLRNEEPEKALDVLDQGAKEEPYNADIRSDMGHVLRDLDQHQKALSCFDSALNIDPEHVDAHVNKGLALLSQGEFDEAWQHYSYRHKQVIFENKRPTIDAVDWTGDNLKNRVLTVWSEQGLGDEILQMSLMQDLATTANEVTLICSERLIHLCKRSFPSVKILSSGESTKIPLQSTVTVKCPLLDTAQALRNRLGKFPSKPGYLVADPELVSHMREKYHKLSDNFSTPLIVAISWQSGHALYGDRNSMPLSNWAPIFQASRNSGRPVLFVTAQYDVDPREVEAASSQNEISIYQDPDVDHGSDMDSAAAQLAASDLVISTSTTTAQLAAALGKPVWHLPSSGLACGWYWLIEGESTPWYPTMRQFRGTKRYVSKEQIQNVAVELSKLLGKL